MIHLLPDIQVEKKYGRLSEGNSSNQAYRKTYSNSDETAMFAERKLYGKRNVGNY